MWGMGFPGGAVVKNLPANAGVVRCRFDPWVGKTPWSRKWQRPPVFLPGESHGQRSLTGYSPEGHRELDSTGETLHALFHQANRAWEEIEPGHSSQAQAQKSTALPQSSQDLPALKTNRKRFFSNALTHIVKGHGTIILFHWVLRSHYMLSACVVFSHSHTTMKCEDSALYALLNWHSHYIRGFFLNTYK